MVVWVVGGLTIGPLALAKGFGRHAGGGGGLSRNHKNWLTP